MYILFTGAPGSKWSSVVNHIYWSDDIDHTDYSEDRTYYHDAETPGHLELMHIGGYWDPGMEFSNTDWDGPFSGKGKRIIKSHTFAHNLNELKTHGYPIVMVYRNDFECLEWWKRCGEFAITYPNYKWFVNLNKMWDHIQKQNKDLLQFIHVNMDNINRVENNIELCDLLDIALPTNFSKHIYRDKDIQVYVYKKFA